MTKYLKNTDPSQRRAGGNILKFMAMMLVFTLVARGASGATLARVNLSTPVRSDIVDAISGVAVVSATDFINQTAPEGLTLAKMPLGIGQMVEAGDIVAVFYLDELVEKHIRENASLERMRHDLERLLRGEAVDPSTLETAQRSLLRAQEDYTLTVRQGEQDIAAAHTDLATLLASIEEEGIELQGNIVRNHGRALEDYHATIAQGQADIAEAQKTLDELLVAGAEAVDDTTLRNAIRSHERALEDLEAAKTQGQVHIAAAQEYLDELRQRRPTDTDRVAIDNALRNRNRAREDYEAARQSNQNNINNAQEALDNAWGVLQVAQLSGDATQIAAALAEVERTTVAFEAAQSTRDTNMRILSRTLEDAETALIQAQQNLTNANQTELERLEADIENAEQALETATSLASDALRLATRSLEDIEASLEQAQRSFNNNVQAEADRLQSAIEAAQDALEAEVTRAADRQFAASRLLEDATYALHAEIERTNAATQNAHDTINSDIERAQTEIQNAINRAETNRRAASRQLEDLVASLQTAEQNHHRSIQQNEDTTTQNLLTASTLELDIANQEGIVSMLSQLIAQDGIMYALYPGRVSMAAQAGGTTTTAPVITLQDIAGGFEANLQIPMRDAERLAIGSETIVATGGGSMFFTPTAIATVSAISQPDENELATITLQLPESNWSVGQRIDAEVVLSRSSYDVSIPISALRSDDMGYFIYVMEHRSTVLGVQNIVVRVNIIINASDSNMVSVSGAIGRGSQIIVGSNKAVSAGDRVRVNY